MQQELIDSMLFGELAEPAQPTRSIQTSDRIFSVPAASCLPSVFKTSELAIGTVALCAHELAGLLASLDQQQVSPEIHPRLASLWFADSLKPVGWRAPEAWDVIAGDYQSADGWIRLHTNLAHHRLAALTVLDCAAERDAVAAAVLRWPGDELEAAVVAEGGCAAAMRSMQSWSNHPQGAALQAEPLVHWNHQDVAVEQVNSRKHTLLSAVTAGGLPLSGLRVLDLTRVLAGPAATRMLSAFGADVLRIDPLDWSETYPTLEMSVGKTRAHLDLKSAAGVTDLEHLIKEADVLIHGYRPGSLDRLGLDAKRLQSLNPALIEASLCAYGWSGPWAERRGFDSLVQMSCGIAHHGMQINQAGKPVPLPVQALDHATGYLLAASVLRGLNHLYTNNRSSRARVSLARTAGLLLQEPLSVVTGTLNGCSEDDFQNQLESTDWGKVARLKFPFTLPGVTPAWLIPAGELRVHQPVWRNETQI